MLRDVLSRIARYPVANWLWNIGVCIDQLLNVLFWIVPMPQGTRLGSGDPDETISHWTAHLAGKGVRWAQRFVAVLDTVDPGHAPHSLIADAEGFNTPERMADRAKRNITIIISGLR